MSTAPYDLKIFGMGGTIDKAVYSYEHGTFIVSDPQIERIISGSNVTLKVSITSIARKDSLELTAEDRALLRQAVVSDPCAKILITHGTDTIRETANSLIGVADKTIVFTGAMLPARFYDSDAAFNIGGAIIAVQTLPPGMYLVMHGRIFDPLSVVKDRDKSLLL